MHNLTLEEKWYLIRLRIALSIQRKLGVFHPKTKEAWWNAYRLVGVYAEDLPLPPDNLEQQS